MMICPVIIRLLVVPVYLFVLAIPSFGQESRASTGTIWLSDSYQMYELYLSDSIESGAASISIQVAAQFDSASMLLVALGPKGIDTTLNFGWFWANDSLIGFYDSSQYQGVFSAVYADDELKIYQTIADSFKYVFTMHPYILSEELPPDKTLLERELRAHNWQIIQTKSTSSGIMRFGNDNVFEYSDQSTDENKSKSFFGKWRMLEFLGVWLISLDWDTQYGPPSLQFLVIDHFDENEIKGILWDGEGLFNYQLMSP